MHFYKRAYTHSFQAFLLELWPRVKLYYVGIRGQKNESTIVFRAGIRWTAGRWRGISLTNEKKLENGNERERKKNEIGE